MSISEICRACLVQMDYFEYRLIDNVSPEIYSFCTAIEIKQEENLPRALCNVCYDLLTKFFDFKHKCIQSQNTLLNYNFIKPEVETKFIVPVDYEPIKSEATFLNFGDIRLNAQNHKYQSTDNAKWEHNSKDLVETDITHCSDYNSGEKSGCTENILVKEEHHIESFDFNDDYQFKAIRPKPVNNNIKKIRKRKLEKEKIKKTGKVKEPKEYFSCEICGKIFYSSTTYKFHKLTHTGNKSSIQCSACTKTFMTLSGLRRHLQSSHTNVDLKYLKCQICGKISKSKEALKMHLKIHDERKPIVCDACGKSFTTAHTFKVHLEIHKEQREKRFTCEHCGKKFYTNKLLVSHMSRQHSRRRYICDICSYPFRAKSNLVTHLLLHEGKKLYKCNICHNSFSAKSTLVEHERLHSGERPFACNFCPKTFVSKRRLTDHTRIHTGEKPFKCDLCDQAFNQCGTLNRHMRVHVRDDPVV